VIILERHNDTIGDSMCYGVIPASLALSCPDLCLFMYGRDCENHNGIGGNRLMIIFVGLL
jgi:hypothetical protein